MEMIGTKMQIRRFIIIVMLFPFFSFSQQMYDEDSLMSGNYPKSLFKQLNIARVHVEGYMEGEKMNERIFSFDTLGRVEVMVHYRTGSS